MPILRLCLQEGINASLLHRLLRYRHDIAGNLYDLRGETSRAMSLGKSSGTQRASWDYQLPVDHFFSREVEVRKNTSNIFQHGGFIFGSCRDFQSPFFAFGPFSEGRTPPSGRSTLGYLGNGPNHVPQADPTKGCQWNSSTANGSEWPRPMRSQRRCLRDWRFKHADFLGASIICGCTLMLWFQSENWVLGTERNEVYGQRSAL